MPNNKKVLIIEDEPDLCLLLKDYFVRKNYDVFVSHSLHEGKALLHTNHPNIVFLDNNLPDGIGWTLAPIIAADFPDTYIILISAFNPKLPEMPAHSKFRLLEKPIALSDLDKQSSGF
jgi:DNA-binding response OmpR family regulator